MTLEDVLLQVESGTDKGLEPLKEYCRFPTISAHKKAQPEPAAFVRRFLAETWFVAREYPTEWCPNVVFGQLCVYEPEPTLRIYHHYDAQSVYPMRW